MSHDPAVLSASPAIVLKPTRPLSDRLRAATHNTHEGVDRSIMAARPFEGVRNYGGFLRVQHGIHREVSALYTRADLAAVFPDMSLHSRLNAVEQDMADLGLALPSYDTAPDGGVAALPQALGWLYVVEGSNLGAAFLLKYAKAMGLSETHGARHLAEPPDGRARYWRAFKGELDRIELCGADEQHAIAGAEAAFGHVRDLIAQHLM